jgi:hypothetical protein
MVDKCEDCPKTELVNFMADAKEIHKDLDHQLDGKVSWSIFIPILILMVGFLGSISSLQISTMKDISKQQVVTMEKMGAVQEKISDAMTQLAAQVAQHDKKIAVHEEKIRGLGK